MNKQIKGFIQLELPPLEDNRERFSFFAISRIAKIYAECAVAPMEWPHRDSANRWNWHVLIQSVDGTYRSWRTGFPNWQKQQVIDWIQTQLTNDKYDH